MFIDLNPICSVWNLGLFRLYKTVKYVSMDEIGDESNFGYWKVFDSFEWNEFVKTNKFAQEIQA